MATLNEDFEVEKTEEGVSLEPNLNEVRNVGYNIGHKLNYLRRLYVSGHLKRYDFAGRDLTHTHGEDKNMINDFHNAVAEFYVLDEKLQGCDNPVILILMDAIRKDVSEIIEFHLRGGEVISEPGTAPSLERNKEGPDNGEE